MRLTYCGLLGALLLTPASHGALVHRYSFDDADIVGATKGQADLVGLDNATPTGTGGGSNITTGQAGQFGQAYAFVRDALPSGSATQSLTDFENLMTIASGAVPSGANDRTISVWFNQTTADSGQNKLFGYGTNVGGQAIDVGLEAGGIRLRHFGGNILYGSGNDFATGGANEGWHHLAVRVNPGASTFADVDVFLDGAQLTGAGSTATTLNTAASAFGIGTTSIPTGGAIQNGFTGLLDELQIYDTALSNTEISQLATRPVPEPGSLLSLVAGVALLTGMKARRCVARTA
ncbi:hypothetical protein Pla175_22110 [Pirellulimonas nuda]|uniref:LamG-like jellyroll fold domain-containing protein n=1 Tax=Pirellulimonas nuda TaxID=2528009 RepID=A0A518DBG7_9BACT|nr:LamG-like jellyroll fold domain-containing protein [Pirellulimonas nuda]QDU88827.1 hypothetical protein Pla175_22110 [Pirellulimonas nuda]